MTNVHILTKKKSKKKNKQKDDAKTSQKVRLHIDCGLILDGVSIYNKYRFTGLTFTLPQQTCNETINRFNKNFEIYKLRWYKDKMQIAQKVFDCETVAILLKTIQKREKLHSERVCLKV